jgi:hypothetical protein
MTRYSFLLPSYDTSPSRCLILRSDIYTYDIVSHTSVVLTTLCETEVCTYLYSSFQCLLVLTTLSTVLTFVLLF